MVWIPTPSLPLASLMPDMAILIWLPLATVFAAIFAGARTVTCQVVPPSVDCRLVISPVPSIARSFLSKPTTCSWNLKVTVFVSLAVRLASGLRGSAGRVGGGLVAMVKRGVGGEDGGGVVVDVEERAANIPGRDVDHGVGARRPYLLGGSGVAQVAAGGLHAR